MDWKASLEALKATLPEDLEGQNSPAAAGAAQSGSVSKAQAAGAAQAGSVSEAQASDNQRGGAASQNYPFPQEKARLDILLDKKGRKGKAATIIAGFTVDDSTIDKIARRLKQRLATGGSARGGEILIQGDKRREAEAALRALGLKCRII